MNHISQLIREIISVIVGILIALLINNWNEKRKDDAYLDQIFSSINKELQESKLDIQRVIPKQLALLDSLDRHMANGDFSLYRINTRADGIHAPQIKTNSWNAIASSKIELIAYEKLSSLAGIQERKENLNNRIEKLLEFVLLNFANTENEKKGIVRFMVSDIIGAELRFLGAIDAVLKEGSENEKEQTNTNN